MALVNCPECGREKVSQSTTCCPSCGYDTYIINSESEFNNAVSEMMGLFGAPENDMVEYIWLGNIGKHPVKIWIYDTSSLDEEFEAWIAIMYADD